MSKKKWHKVEVPEMPWKVAVQVDVLDGRARLIGLCIEAHGSADVISSDLLRTFPIRAVVRAAQITRPATRPPEDFTEIRRKPGVAIPEQHYEWVASAYADAVEAGESPSQSIQKLWSVSRPTAQTWIRRARERGLIEGTSRMRPRKNMP